MNFQIGPWLFIPQKCILCSNSTGDIELEPILFKLLDYFVNNQDKIISRQELVEHVWQQTFVDDNAINRAMSELRKKLSHPENPVPLIKTHYRKGYSITVEVIAVPTSGASAAKNTPITKRQENLESKHPQTTEDNNKPVEAVQKDERVNYKHYRLMFFILSSLVLLIISYHIFTYFQPAPTTEPNKNNLETQVNVKTDTSSSRLKNATPLHSIQGVTWNSGQEFRPIVSSDSLLFAYNNRAEPKISSFVKRKSDLKEVQLVYKDFDVTSISWQYGTHKVLAEVTNYQDECFLGLFDLSNFSENPPVTKLKTCEKELYGGAHLASNGKKLYLIELDQVKQGGQVVVYDLKAKKSTLLIPSGDTQFGITNLKLSPDNNKILYQRHQRDQPLSVHMMNLITKDHKKLYQIPHAGAPLVFDWFPDSQHIAIQIIKDLTVFDLSGDKVASYPININNWVVGLAIEDTSNILIAMASSQNLEIVNISEPFNEQLFNVTSLIKSDSMNYYITASDHHTQASYFISNRTGSLQIWRKLAQQVEQVTAFPLEAQKKIGPLVLSPDQQRILYLRGEHLEIFDLTTKSAEKIEMPIHGAIGSYQWHQNQKKVYYDMVHDGIRQIWSTTLATNTQNQITQNSGKMLLKNQQHQLYYINDNYLHHLNSSKKHQITIPIAHCWCSVSLTDQALYSLDSSNSLYKMALDSDEVTSTLMPFRTADIKMITDNNAVAAKYNNAASQIKRVTWQTPLINSAK